MKRKLLKSVSLQVAFQLVLVLMCLTQSYGTVYQYSVPVGSRQAYLWIPPECKQIRGVIISLNNLLERNWLEDPIIREVAAKEGLGIIWLSGGGKGATLTADMKHGEGEVLLKMLKELADESGYTEIEFAPVIAMGHSANGHFSWNVPNWDTDRTIAAIPIKTVPLPPSISFEGVPLCYIVGETTEWPQYRDMSQQGDRDFFWPVVRESAVVLRTANENNLIGVVTDPGGGHFDWSEKQARFVSLYIHKACEYRLPKKSPLNGFVKLKKLSKESGWLTDIGGMIPDKFAPAPYKKYKGDPKKAYWFFDKKTALAAVEFCGDRLKREKQMLTFVQNGQPLPIAAQGFAPLKFSPEQDGLTFKVEGSFLSEVPPELTGAGTKLGHAPGPIKFRVITGPAVQTGPETFRIQFDRQGMGGTLWIQEEHPGDEKYRHAVQPGQMIIQTKLTIGTPQVITFPKIEDQKKEIRSIELNATSDSKLTVGYYVVAGPAEIQGNSLIFTKIPVRSKYPVKITVVAYQWGRTTEPFYQSAEPIKQTFYIGLYE